MQNKARHVTSFAGCAAKGSTSRAELGTTHTKAIVERQAADANATDSLLQRKASMLTAPQQRAQSPQQRNSERRSRR
jgi:hypothetical protein